MLSEQSSPLETDYTISLATLLTDVSRDLLSRHGHLWMFAITTHRAGDLDSTEIPSWVFRADRTSDLDQDPSNLSNVFRVPNCLEVLDRVRMQANGPHTLTLQGLAMDTIAVVACDAGTSHYQAEWMVETMTTLGFTAQEPQAPSRLAEFATTMMCGTAETGSAAGEDVIAIMVHYLKLLLRRYASDHKDNESDTESGLDAAYDAVEQNCRLMYASHRRLALTINGRYALCSAQSRVGDRIVVLRGSLAPCLLRPYGVHYQFLGEAYVHGMMKEDGDRLVRLQLAAEYEEQTFVVR